MKLNTNCNAYTITYATIVVVIVAVVLALVNQGLKPKQEANIKLDQQKQMLVALNQELGADPAALYESLVQDTVKMDKDNKKADIIRFEVDGATKYILRLHGAGLWGGIGGYLALDEDKNTIFGINFNHESETPGLGALIVEKPFREQFFGKKIRNAANEVVSVVVLKKGNKAENGEEQVDAVSGATITSTGVSDMLKANLCDEYAEFLGEITNYELRITNEGKEEDHVESEN
jgi:Na+-transporting NADH:ubiquinone oxidoreductase subunit C